jgi:hypothetical protein
MNPAVKHPMKEPLLGVLFNFLFLAEHAFTFYLPTTRTYGTRLPKLSKRNYTAYCMLPMIHIHLWILTDMPYSEVDTTPGNW